jgi:hypothetical protein
MAVALKFVRERKINCGLAYRGCLVKATAIAGNNGVAVVSARVYANCTPPHLRLAFVLRMGR